MLGLNQQKILAFFRNARVFRTRTSWVLMALAEYAATYVILAEDEDHNVWGEADSTWGPTSLLQKSEKKHTKEPTLNKITVKVARFRSVPLQKATTPKQFGAYNEPAGCKVS